MSRAVFVAVLLLVTPGFAQQPVDPAKLVPMLQAQRDAANNQVAFCATQNADYAERIRALEAELAKLKPAEPAK
jgi:hypothetical protein